MDDPIPIPDNLLELSRKTGYKIAQVYAQRKMGPPSSWTGPPPPKEYEVYIGKLPQHVFEDELFPLFSDVGKIYEFRLMMHFSKCNKGYGFATYTCKEDADRAVARLDKYEIRPGYHIDVENSVNWGWLHIGKLPTDKSQEEVFAEISHYTQGVQKVIVYSNGNDKTQKNRGFALVQYETHYAACMARSILVPGNAKLFDTYVKVDWVSREGKVNEEHMRSATNLYVRNIPLHINESYLQHIFSLQGSVPVHRVKKIRDFAFVHYYSRQDAEIAKELMNGFNIEGNCIEVTWAKPPTNQHASEKPNLNNKYKTKFYNCNSRELGVREAQGQNKTTAVDSPIKVLSRICHAKGWGEPIYHVIYTSSSADENETTFSTKVFIPNLPQPMKYFSFSGTFFSPANAKNCAAMNVIKNITYSNSFQTPSVCPVAKNNLQNNNIIPVNSGTGKVFPSWNDQSVWNPPFDIPPPVNNDFLCQDEAFLQLLASAAKLAKIELQSEWLSNSSFKPGSISI